MLFFLLTLFLCCFQWKIEDLLVDIKETETEVARWREACELEVEAGKNEVEERDKVVKTSSVLSKKFFDSLKAIQMCHQYIRTNAWMVCSYVMQES